MADNRKYYYLKLKEDFFDTDEMKILESMKDGYLYSNILLKLYLKSLSNSGRLMYRNVIPYTPEILATLTGHQVGTVEKALDVFKKFIEDLMGNTREIAGKSERTIKDTERTREEDLYCVFRIEKATEMYREECEKSGSEEAKRRYRELSMMYLDEKPYTVQEISEVENISDKTVYKDIGIACGIVAIYLLGADF